MVFLTPGPLRKCKLHLGVPPFLKGWGLRVMPQTPSVGRWFLLPIHWIGSKKKCGIPLDLMGNVLVSCRFFFNSQVPPLVALVVFLVQSLLYPEGKQLLGGLCLRSLVLLAGRGATGGAGGVRQKEHVAPSSLQEILGDF